MKRKSITYYVSSVNGNDKNDGLTQETPFRTLHRIRGSEFSAGDRVLLERGSVFEGQYLHIRGKGEIGDPIEIASYGVRTAWHMMQIPGMEPYMNIITADKTRVAVSCFVWKSQFIISFERM